VHFARSVDERFRPSISCRLAREGVPVRGVLVDCSARAAGCFAFVPREPLPAGEWLEVRWQAPTTLLGPDEAIGAVKFRVR